MRAKELRYAIDLSGELRTEDGTALEADPAWTPEHLLLAALVRCSLKSLDYHARRAGNALEDAQGSARAMITKREADGRYAMVELDVELAVRLTQDAGASELFEKAERDCFIGASLAIAPTYRWSLL